MTDEPEQGTSQVIEVVSDKLSKRRVVIDVALLVAILACASIFFELRGAVKALNEQLPAIDARVMRIEERERSTNERVATKEDVKRVEQQLTELRVLLLNGARR